MVRPINQSTQDQDLDHPVPPSGAFRKARCSSPVSTKIKKTSSNFLELNKIFIDQYQMIDMIHTVEEFREYDRLRRKYGRDNP
jgi:hypothetical protein